MSYLKFLIVFSLVGVAMLFGGCGSDTTNSSSTVNNYVDRNITDVVVEVPEMPQIDPYGDGTYENPYVINMNGVYRTNAETYYVTSPFFEDCNVTVTDRQDKNLFDAIIYDNYFNVIDPVGFYDFNLTDAGVYNLVLKTYVATEVSVRADCWE